MPFPSALARLLQTCRILALSRCGTAATATRVQLLRPLHTRPHLRAEVVRMVAVEAEAVVVPTAAVVEEAAAVAAVTNNWNYFARNWRKNVRKSSANSSGSSAAAKCPPRGISVHLAIL